MSTESATALELSWAPALEHRVGNRPRAPSEHPPLSTESATALELRVGTRP